MVTVLDIVLLMLLFVCVILCLFCFFNDRLRLSHMRSMGFNDGKLPA